VLFQPFAEAAENVFLQLIDAALFTFVWRYWRDDTRRGGDNV
jgi:hypothetical protein